MYIRVLKLWQMYYSESEFQTNTKICWNLIIVHCSNSLHLYFDWFFYSTLEFYSFISQFLKLPYFQTRSNECDCYHLMTAFAIFLFFFVGFDINEWSYVSQKIDFVVKNNPASKVINNKWQHTLFDFLFQKT